MLTPVWISLGSNLGDRRAILDAAIQALNQTEGIFVSRVSTYRETVPVGGPSGQGPFLNAAARLETTLTPRELLLQTQRIETELGRVRIVRWGERTLDIDLLIFGSKFVDDPDLKLPHPRLAVRRFVLEPLAEIAPDVTDTITRRTVADLLANLNRRPWVVMFDKTIPNNPFDLVGAIARDLGGVASCEATTVTSSRQQADGLDLDRRQRLTVAFWQALGTSLAGGAPNFPGWLVVDRVTHVLELNWAWSAIPWGSGDSIGRMQDRSRRAAESYPVPTFIISRDPTRAAPAHPSYPPVYIPEATDPDAIVAEVAAVCRGIAGA